jgi:hypothetical protein
VDGILSEERHRSGTATDASTLFPVCMWLPWGFIRCREFWQAFFELFLTVLAANPTSGSRNLRTWRVSQRVPEVTTVLPNPLKNNALKLKVANVLLARVPV